MKYFNWNNEENEKLQKDRGVLFEEIVLAIEQGQLLDIIDHPNKDKYDNQNIFVVTLHNYVWLVPFVEDENEVFLKTITPSRKATKQYLHGGKNND